MKYFQHIADYDIHPLKAELACSPDLWNQHNARKTAEGSPHAQMDDIWVRFRDPDELTSPEKYNEPHEAVNYPAWDALPAFELIVDDIMARVEADALGGILITRIPPQGKILPHNDRGGWHAEHYNRKVYLPIQANDKCVNHCMDESVAMKAGECWSFNNLLTHSVENNGDSDRITAIICMRVNE